MQNESQEQRFKGYLELAKMPYKQAVDTLKKKYGELQKITLPKIVIQALY